MGESKGQRLAAQVLAVNRGADAGAGIAAGQAVTTHQALALVGSGSGTISSRVTALLVKSRTAFMFPSGTPLVFH